MSEPSTSRCSWKNLQALALVATSLATGGYAHAQSFICSRASTPVEHAICADRELGDLDTALAGELNDSMSGGSADQRRDYVWAQRRWLAYRDKHCAPTSLAAGQSISGCLAALYRERIAYLKSLKSADIANCQKIADRYRPLASAHPGEPPLSVLAASPASGIALAKPLARMTNPAAELPEWAGRQTPPFVVPARFTQSLISMGDWALEKLPDVNFYAVSSIEGTAHCYDSRYFAVSNGRAEVELTPPGFDDEGGASCGVRRSFGRIDDASVLLEENYNWTPDMSADITVATWNDGGFDGACKVSFSFAPRFSEQTLNAWEGSPESARCTTGECTELRQAAFELAQAVQKDPVTARIGARAKLSAAQLAEFETEVRLATRNPTEKNADPGSITQENPLRLPYLHDGRVYLASLGHFTIGWRYFADWHVAFEALGGGQLTPRGEFAVGMMKGDLETVSVSAVR